MDDMTRVLYTDLDEANETIEKLKARVRVLEIEADEQGIRLDDILIGLDRERARILKTANTLKGIQVQ